ncbi:MAG TPA: tRNA (N(6)-L-threonylcarbamoyladenosine(37)-C(2))-methylthiotransferase MtaB [Syntrophomonas sp.]|nr:tRNA (N(6)-L-threonylcarbamoyladenosine(37)-C(2))-methylthiotransferase MtaB [Syntrophomonas sp.]
MNKIAFHTLGCKVNQVETEGLIDDFTSRGYELVDFEDVADIYVINSCTVTHVSDRKSRAMIRRAVRRNPNALVVATGCGAQVDAEQLAAIKGVNLVVGNRDKENLAAIIEDYWRRGRSDSEIFIAPIGSDEKPREILYKYHHQRTRAFVKIQDGCQSFCSYCIVPMARGPVRSKAPEAVLHEIEQLVYLGYREIVLTGIHTGFYGVDIPGWNLSRLVAAILEQIQGSYRIRLSSIEPLEVDENLLEIMAADRRICRHLHIPLQSGSDRVLKNMGRRYDRDYYRRLVRSICDRIPGIAFTADVMVGFPGEDEDDFRYTHHLIAELPLSDLHVFKYSMRRGTKAALMIPQVPEPEKNRRSKILLELAEEKQLEFAKSFIGQRFDLLVERKSGKDSYIGLTDNYLEVSVQSRQDLCGQSVEVEIASAQPGIINGNIRIEKQH